MVFGKNYETKAEYQAAARSAVRDYRAGVGKMEEVAAKYKISPAALSRWNSTLRVERKAKADKHRDESAVQAENSLLKRMLSRLTGIPLSALDDAIKLSMLMSADKIAHQTLDELTKPVFVNGN